MLKINDMILDPRALQFVKLDEVPYDPMKPWAIQICLAGQIVHVFYAEETQARADFKALSAARDAWEAQWGQPVAYEGRLL
jgi:hypothetical protein